MKVYDETKTNELTAYDLTTGYLRPDKRFVLHHEAKAATAGIPAETKAKRLEAEGKAVKQIAGKWYNVLKTYDNGGEDVEEIRDTPAVPAAEAWDEYEDIQVYTAYTPEELAEREKEKLRALRAAECFPVINRGRLWYDNLTGEQLDELREWYNAWLDVTETKKVPQKPAWIDEKITAEVI